MLFLMPHQPKVGTLPIAGNAHVVIGLGSLWMGGATVRGTFEEALSLALHQSG